MLTCCVDQFWAPPQYRCFALKFFKSLKGHDPLRHIQEVFSFGKEKLLLHWWLYRRWCSDSSKHLYYNRMLMFLCFYWKCKYQNIQPITFVISQCDFPLCIMHLYIQYVIKIIYLTEVNVSCSSMRCGIQFYSVSI